MRGRSSDLLEQLKVIGLPSFPFLARLAFSPSILQKPQVLGRSYTTLVRGSHVAHVEQRLHLQCGHDNSKYMSSVVKCSKQNIKKILDCSIELNHAPPDRISCPVLCSTSSDRCSHQLFLDLRDICNRSGLQHGLRKHVFSIWGVSHLRSQKYKYHSTAKHFGHASNHTSVDSFLDDLERSLASINPQQTTETPGHPGIMSEFERFSRQTKPKPTFAQQEKAKKASALATRIEKLRGRRLVERARHQATEEGQQVIAENLKIEDQEQELALDDELNQIPDDGESKCDRAELVSMSYPFYEMVEDKSPEPSMLKISTETNDEIIQNMGTHQENPNASEMIKPAKQNGIEMSNIKLLSKGVESYATKLPLHNAENNTWWEINMSAVRSWYDRRLQLSRPVHLHSKTGTWVSSILRERTVKDMRTKWLGLSGGDQSEMWQDTMIYVLRYAVHAAPNFLLATCMDGPEYWQLADVLDILVDIKRRFLKKDFAAYEAAVLKVFQVLVEMPGASNAQIAQYTILFLMKHCPDESLHPTYNRLINARYHIDIDILLKIATNAAFRSRFRLAVDALEKAAKDGADVNSDEFRTVCCKVLGTLSGRPNASRRGQRLVRMISSHGGHLDTAILSILIKNAIRSEEFETAWKIFGTFSTDFAPSDDYIYTLLLRLCRQKNWHIRSKQILDAINQRRMKSLTPALANEFILSAVASPALRIIPNTFHRALNLYQMHWNMGPLNDLGITAEYSQMNIDQPQPSSQVLGVLVATFIDTANKELVQKLYDRFLDLRQRHHPAVISLASNHHIWDCFLRSHCMQLPGSMHQCYELLLAMSPRPDAVSSPGYCEPALSTYSTMLAGLARSGDLGNAERLINYMREKHLEPTSGVWNSLIHGYAKAGKEGLINVIERMIRAGHRPNASTMRAMNSIKNPIVLGNAFLAAKRTSSYRDFAGLIVWRTAIKQRISELMGIPIK